jgi:hypothetical protein
LDNAERIRARRDDHSAVGSEAVHQAAEHVSTVSRLLHLQATAGNRAVQRLLGVTGDGHGLGAAVLGAGLAVQRQGGGFRPPPRPPPRRQNVPNRRGTTNPRSSNRSERAQRGRREAFERRERERIDAARRKFEEEVARSQKELARWATEGSHPKTPRERAVRAILKFWELWGDVSENWDKTHKKFDNLISKRLEVGKETTVAKATLASLDRELLDVINKVKELDQEFFTRVTEWEALVHEWREGVNWLDPQSVISAVGHVVGLFFSFVIGSSAITLKQQEADKAIFALSYHLSFAQPRQFLPEQDSMREAD